VGLLFGKIGQISPINSWVKRPQLMVAYFNSVVFFSFQRHQPSYFVAVLVGLFNHYHSFGDIDAEFGQRIFYGRRDFWGEIFGANLEVLRISSEG
jgi:hypothetical protein